MTRILIVEPDSARATQVAALVRTHLRAHPITVNGAERARAALVYSIPDVILMSPLLSGHDEARINASLRHLGDAAAHVQVLTVPVLAEAPVSEPPRRGLLLGLLPARPAAAAPDGCEAAVFALQIQEYVELAASLRKAPPEPVEPPFELILAHPIEAPPIPEPEPEPVMSVVDVLPLNFDPPEPDAWTPAPAEAVAAVMVPAEALAPAMVPVEAVAVAVEPAPPKPKKEKKAAKSGGPDEWGLFDPAQCGFAALLEKLDRLKDGADRDGQEPDGPTPVVAY